MLLTASEIPQSVEIQRRLTSIHIDEWIKDDVFKARIYFFIAVA